MMRQSYDHDDREENGQAPQLYPLDPIDWAIIGCGVLAVAIGGSSLAYLWSFL